MNAITTDGIKIKYLNLDLHINFNTKIFLCLKLWKIFEHTDLINCHFMFANMKITG
jgi:hypothetical protein